MGKLNLKRLPNGVDVESLIMYYMTSGIFCIDGTRKNAVQIAFETLVDLSLNAKDETLRGIAASKLMEFAIRIAEMKREKGRENNVKVIIPDGHLLKEIDRVLSKIDEQTESELIIAENESRSSTGQ